MMSPCLFVAVSSHGFGHLAQTAPVINALWRQIPSLRVVVQSLASKELLARQFAREFEHIQQPVDVAMVMSGSLDVQVAESAAEYIAFHQDWDEGVRRQTELLHRYQPDLVLANVPYLLPAAALQAGIPSVALCSLNWLDIYSAYCSEDSRFAVIRQQMLEAYRAAALFLQPLPSMPMTTLPNRRPIGPIARRGQSQRMRIDTELGLEPDEKLVLVSLGGIPSSLPLARWPTIPGVRFLVSGNPEADYPQIHPLESLGIPYIDLLCSCDALITKPGYGSFAEAACNRVPVLYVPRDGWPEAPFLTAWLQTVVPCREISRTGLEQGAFADELNMLLEQEPMPAVEPTGIFDAVESLLPWLRDQSHINSRS